MGNKLAFWKRGGGDPDTAWKEQNKEQKQNPLYQLINLQKEGDLINIYENEGPEALRKFMDDNIEKLLYNNGAGKIVTKADYFRWKNRGKTKVKEAVVEVDRSAEYDIAFTNHADVYSIGRQSITSGRNSIHPLWSSDSKEEPDTVLPDTEWLVEFPEDDFNKVTDHKACWDMDMRGAMGETALHLLVLHDTPATLDIAKIMLEKFPSTAWDYYEADEYYGESSLHFAIVYGNLEMVKLLVECGADVNLRATGRFFLPEDQKRVIRKKKTNFEGYAYYGEYPLAFAACFGHEEIYDYLIEKGADPNVKDSFGNSVLHMMVICNQLGMFGYAVKHHAKKADLEVENNQNLTPLTLASKLGRNNIFKEIIELQSVEIWRYSNVTCAIYPIAPLDTIGPNGKTNWSSALIYITDGDSDDHLEMLEGGVIKQLLDEKWKTFGRMRFFMQMAMALLHLILLSIAIYLRPDTNYLAVNSSKDIVRFCAEIAVVAYSSYSLFTQLIEIRSQGIMGTFKNQLSAPAKFVFNISCVLILVCVPMRFLKSEGVEIILLAVAAPCAWFFMLFFARGLSPLGPFVIMIYKMFATDMVRFVIIIVIFLLQFSQGFYYLFKDIEDENITTFKTIWGTIMQLVQMTFGEFKYEDFDQTRQPELTKFVFGVFAVLVPILLLNMLIAMMGNTYQLVISRSAKEWKRQWAKIIIVLERAHSQKKLVEFQENYSVDMLGGKEGDRGLMVIKTSKKTRARQRKGAINNWKRIVKEIKDLIKDQKKSGETGPLDLSSSSFSDRQQRKRRSVRQKQAVGLDEDPLDFEESQSAEALLSTIKQVSWTHDIDLTKGTPFSKPENIPEEDEPTGENDPLLLRKKPTPKGIDNPVMALDGKQTNQTSTSKDNKAAPKGRKGRVAPELPTVSAVQSQAKSAPSGGAAGTSGARQRRGGGSDPKKKTEIFTISGGKGSKSSSSSSLSNLIKEADTDV